MFIKATFHEEEQSESICCLHTSMLKQPAFATQWLKRILILLKKNKCHESTITRIIARIEQKENAHSL